APGGGGTGADGEGKETPEAAPLAELPGDGVRRLSGWMEPPWLKEGWFHAYLLYAGTVADTPARSAIGEMLLRRTQGGFASPAERVNVERRLVSALTRDCERAPIGYALRRE